MWVRFPSPALEPEYAIVAQLVERHLAKVETAGSSPVYRSYFYVAESHKMWGSAVFVYMCSDYI